MSSAQRATCHAPSPLCSRLVLVILWFHDPFKSLIGNYFKHLLMYEDGQFAKHPYFALNTELRWWALQAGCIYIRQHPHDAQLSVEELRDMVGREGEVFSNRVLHYATSLRGTRQYWFKQHSRVIAMVDTIGLPTIFFTHSAADLQWPELARLICPDDPDFSSSHSKALQENPAIADWFFHHRTQKFDTYDSIDAHATLTRSGSPHR